MFRLYPFISILLILSGCSADTADRDVSGTTQNQDDTTETTTKVFNAWLDEEFNTYLDFYPQSKTRLGIMSDYDKLNDVSIKAMERVLAWRRSSVADMQAKFNRDELSEQGKISWDLWLFMLKQAESDVAYRYHSTIFGWRGPHTGLPNSLINYHKVASLGDLDAYLARIQAVDRQLGQYLIRAQAALDRGITTSYSNYQLALENSQRVIAGQPYQPGESTGLWRDINLKINSLIESGDLSADEAEDYRAKFRSALLNEVKPAYEALISWLTNTMKTLDRTRTGASSQPDGKAYYEYRLQRNTTLPLSADEVHATGLAEVARIHSEMDAIRDAVGFEGSLGEFFTFMREDPQFYYPSDDAGRAAYIKLAENYIAGMAEALPDYFDQLPRALLEVRRVETFREQPGGAAHYARATPDGSLPGIFYMHLIDMSTHPIYRIENLSYHEGLPGHHLQLTIQQELQDIPQFRTYHGYTAYSEGWGLYSEYLAKEMGFYKDPYNDYGRLSGELWRAIRLVVDTGLHAKGWSEQDAIDYALANSSKATNAVTSEISRYLYMPGQATAYKVGMMKILELRDRAMRVLGPDFNYGEFHGIVLGSGSMPLPLLEVRVSEWLADHESRSPD